MAKEQHSDAATAIMDPIIILCDAVKALARQTEVAHAEFMQMRGLLMAQAAIADPQVDWLTYWKSSPELAKLDALRDRSNEALGRECVLIDQIARTDPITVQGVRIKAAYVLGQLEEIKTIQSDDASTFALIASALRAAAGGIAA